LKYGAPPSHNVIDPLGSSFGSCLFLLPSFLVLFSLLTVTQPGILTIGVPTKVVTGTTTGIDCGGVAIQILASEIEMFLTSLVPTSLIRPTGMFTPFILINGTP